MVWTQYSAFRDEDDAKRGEKPLLAAACSFAALILTLRRKAFAKSSNP